MACINSHIGVDAEDPRVSYNRFKDAAGIFTFIIGNFLHAPSTDLSQETVKALSKLMLAQAQESFVERLLSENSSSPMISKLAKGTSNLFKSAGDSLQAVFTDKSWGEKAWHQYCSVKSKYYLSVAHDASARNFENSGKYGEAIAHTQAAISNIQTIYKSSVPSQYVVFFDVVSTLQESLKEKIVKLEKENDLIYHCTVPSVASIADIPAVEAATPTPMNELYKDGQELSKLIGKELFEKVIPLSVHQQTSMYSEEKATFLRAEGEKIEIANEELASALEFLDLPNALRTIRFDGSDILALSKSQGIDAQVNDWAGQINGMAATNTTSLGGLDGMKRNIYESMKNAERLLQDEEKAFENNKSELRHQWTQAPSATMNSGLLADVSRIKHDLSNASLSDDKLKGIIGACESDIQILKMGPNSAQLKALFEDVKTQPVSAGGASLLDLDQNPDSSIDVFLDQVKDMLDSLQKLKEERNASFVEFKDRVHKDDISGILILNSKNPDIQESLFKSELAKFQPYQAQFDDSIQYQQNLLKGLTMTWKKVLEDKSVQSKTRQTEELKVRRSGLVNRFQTAFESWKDSQQGLNKAFEFYEKLLAFTKSTLSNAEDFCTNRREEANRLRSSLSTSSTQNSQEMLRDQLSRLSVSSNPSSSGVSGYSAASASGYAPVTASSHASYQPAATSPHAYQPVAPSPQAYQQPAAPSPQAYQQPSTSSPQAYRAPSVSSPPAVSQPTSSGWGDLSFLDKPAAPPKPSAPAPAATAPVTTQPQYSSYSNYSQPQQPPTSQQPSQPSQSPQQTQYSYPPAQSQPHHPYNYQAPAQASYPSYQSQPSQPSYSTQPSQPSYSTQPYPSQSPAQPVYQGYQSQYVQQPQYGGYQQPSQQPPQQPSYPSYTTPSPGASYGYGTPAPQKDYSRMPPPPPPPGSQAPPQPPHGQGYYRQY